MTVVQRLNTNHYERIYRQNGIDDSFLRLSNTKEKLLDYELIVNLDSEKMNKVVVLNYLTLHSKMIEFKVRLLPVKREVFLFKTILNI